MARIYKYHRNGFISTRREAARGSGTALPSEEEMCTSEDMEKGRLRIETTPVQLAMLAATIDPWASGADPARAIGMAETLLECAIAKLEEVGESGVERTRRLYGEKAGEEEAKKTGGVMTTDSMKDALYG